MRHVSELAQSNERVLIVNKEVSKLADQLKTRLGQYDVAIQITPTVPQSYTRFNRIFFINQKPNDDLIIPHNIKATVIQIKPFGKSVFATSKHQTVKYIFLSSENISDDELDRILWFSISQSKERILDLRNNRKKQNNGPEKISENRTIPPRQTLITSLLILLVSICIGFIVPLIPATLLHVFILKSYAKDDYTPVEFLLPLSSGLTQASSTLFIPARPFYSLFSVSLGPESYIRFNSHTISYFKKAKELALAQQQLLSDISSIKMFDKVSQLNVETRIELERVDTNLPTYADLDNIKKSLKNKILFYDKLSKVLPIASTIVTDITDQTLLILVTNNSRVRGTGGIISSVGVVKISNQKIISSKFYSPKDLQPKQTNLEDISPILITYTPAEANSLNDSTTSVDFFDTQEKLRSSLSALIGNKRPTMTLLVTTTAMQNILASFPDLQLNGGKEIVNSENISIKQRIYESNHTFVPAVINKMNETLGTVNSNALFSSVITSFNEKQLSLLSSRPKVQKMLDELYWSGKTISPKCLATTQRCINDYFFSVDQDLSDRDGSSYIQKSESKTVRFLNPSTLESTIRISWKNETPFPADQGGLYKLYTQILLPPNSKITQITKNNVLVEQVDSLSGQYNILGTYLEVEPQKTLELAITFKIPTLLRETTNYQLITQKQLGSFTNNISFDFLIPNGYVLGSTNIDAVVNNDRISYNGILNTDKLFFVEIKRKQ